MYPHMYESVGSPFNSEFPAGAMRPRGCNFNSNAEDIMFPYVENKWWRRTDYIYVCMYE